MENRNSGHFWCPWCLFFCIFLVVSLSLTWNDETSRWYICHTEERGPWKLRTIHNVLWSFTEWLLGPSFPLKIGDLSEEVLWCMNELHFINEKLSSTEEGMVVSGGDRPSHGCHCTRSSFHELFPDQRFSEHACSNLVVTYCPKLGRHPFPFPLIETNGRRHTDYSWTVNSTGWTWMMDLSISVP